MKPRHERILRPLRRAQPEDAPASVSAERAHYAPLLRPDGLADRDRQRIRTGETVAIEHGNGSATIYRVSERLRAAMSCVPGDRLLIATSVDNLGLRRIITARGLAVDVLGEAA
jgi:hypothetical protein